MKSTVGICGDLMIDWTRRLYKKACFICDWIVQLTNWAKRSQLMPETTNIVNKPASPAHKIMHNEEITKNIARNDACFYLISFQKHQMKI